MKSGTITQTKEVIIVDLIKIGKYIAGKRKGLGLTQRQLADKLGMSDKSVSKWERGICLPDVSVYSDLCQILGISINEFLAGEDIGHEDLIRKSEENIIGIAAESKRKQNLLKKIICVLLAVSILDITMIGVSVYRAARPQNFIVPVEKDSIEMETAQLLSGPDGAYIYKFTTTDEYESLRLYFSEFHSGILQGKENMELGFSGVHSPEYGEILIIPDFDKFVVKVIIASEGSRLSTEIPILEDVTDREYYGRSATEISERTDIRYNEEQALIALIYDNNELRVLDIYDLMDGRTDSLSVNDYVYYFSFEFCKK